MEKVKCEGVGDSDGFFELVAKQDLQIGDCTYANSFPANIEWGFPVVVQIPQTGQGVVLYTCKASGNQANSYLPMLFSERYTNDIYIFNT